MPPPRPKIIEKWSVASTLRPIPDSATLRRSLHFTAAGQSVFSGPRLDRRPSDPHLRTRPKRGSGRLTCTPSRREGSDFLCLNSDSPLCRVTVRCRRRFGSGACKHSSFGPTRLTQAGEGPLRHYLVRAFLTSALPGRQGHARAARVATVRRRGRCRASLPAGTGERLTWPTIPKIMSGVAPRPKALPVCPKPSPFG